MEIADISIDCCVVDVVVDMSVGCCTGGEIARVSVDCITKGCEKEELINGFSFLRGWEMLWRLAIAC